MRDPYRLIVESIRDYAIMLLDVKGNVTSWNPGAQIILGYAADEIIGKSFSLFYPPEDRATRPAAELEQASSTGRFEEEGWRQRKDGSRFLANVVLTPVIDDGAIVGFAKVTRDLSERALLRALSTPVTRLWPGILLLPLVGDVDEHRAEQIMQVVLDRVIEDQAKVIIIDVSGVSVMGTFVSSLLIKTVTAVQVLGARSIVTGIGPQASRSIVRLGVDLSNVTTHNHLAGGVELALRYIDKNVSDATSRR